jgi:hypothetical protein
MIEANSTILWAAIVILAVPLLIILAGEFDERLRQRESTLRSAIDIIRSWALPFFAAWAILVPVLAFERGDLAVRFVATGLLLSLGLAGLRVIRALGPKARATPRSCCSPCPGSSRSSSSAGC